jgi:hypothetical protein
MFSKKSQISNFINIRPSGAELFHADRQTDTHDEVNSRFSQFYGCAPKNRGFRYLGSVSGPFVLYEVQVSVITIDF